MKAERSPITDYDIERFLRMRTADPDPALWSDILAAADANAQRTGLWGRWSLRRQAFALVLSALLLVVMAGAIGIGVGLIRPVPPAPSPEADRSLTSDALNFDRPFSYTLPPDSSLELDRQSAAIYRFEGADRGVAIFAVRAGSTTEDCQPELGRSDISGTAGEVLENLRVIGGLGIGAESTTTLDTHRALTADVDPRRATCEGGADIHVPDMPSFNDFVPLDIPGRLILADVDGLVVGVQIWTARPEDLEGWIPTASEFVATIHFLTGRTAEFDVPFAYSLPSASGLGLRQSANAQVRFQEGDRGVTVFAVGPEALVHACEDRRDLVGSPEQMLVTLGSLTRSVGPSALFTLDSHPALVADIDSAACRFDIHVVPGLSTRDTYVEFPGRSRLILAEVQGIVVGVLIWAEDPEELDAWRPTAMEFVESIQFLDP